MKNAREYEKKVKKLLGKLPKAKKTESFENPIEQLIFAILEADASSRQARKAVKALQAEYVDFNELRVSPTKEILEAIGRDYPFSRDRADAILRVLGNVYERSFAMSLDDLADLPKRQQRRYLTELGLDPYAEAVLASQVFGAHAIPVDQSLVDCLKIEELIHPDSDVADVQGFLERVIPQKNGLAAHQFFRQFIADHSSALSKIQQERMDAQKHQRQQANARAKAEAEAELAEERGQTAVSCDQKQDAKKPKSPSTRKKDSKGAKGAKAPKAKASGKTQKGASKKKSAQRPSRSTKSSAAKKTKARKSSRASKSAQGKSKTAGKAKKKKTQAPGKSPKAKATRKSSKKTTKKTTKKTAKKTAKKAPKRRKSRKSSGK